MSPEQHSAHRSPKLLCRQLEDGNSAPDGGQSWSVVQHATSQAGSKFASGTHLHNRRCELHRIQTTYHSLTSSKFPSRTPFHRRRWELPWGMCCRTQRRRRSAEKARLRPKRGKYLTKDFLLTIEVLEKSSLALGYCAVLAPHQKSRKRAKTVRGVLSAAHPGEHLPALHSTILPKMITVTGL